MMRNHGEAAYDKWFRAQVPEALDDPRPGISHEQVEAEWANERADLLNLVQKAA